MTSQITSNSTVYSTSCLGEHQRKHQNQRWENQPVTGGFPSQRASNAEIISIAWRHNVFDFPYTASNQSLWHNKINGFKWNPRDTYNRLMLRTGAYIKVKNFWNPDKAFGTFREIYTTYPHMDNLIYRNWMILCTQFDWMLSNTGGCYLDSGKLIPKVKDWYVVISGGVYGITYMLKQLVSFSVIVLSMVIESFPP